MTPAFKRLATALVVGGLVIAAACALIGRRGGTSSATSSTEAPRTEAPSPSPSTEAPSPSPSTSPGTTPAAPAAPATPTPPAAHEGKTPDTEAALMTRLRALKDSDPAVIPLAREGNKRFPDSADAPERASRLIHALAEQGQPYVARGEAEDMVNHYPDSPWVREIERFTGAHRRRNARLNDAGQVELYDPPKK